MSAQQQHDQTAVARDGLPAAVVAPTDERESLHETLDILSDTDTAAAIRQARKEVARGDVYTTEEVLAAFRQRSERPA